MSVLSPIKRYFRTYISIVGMEFLGNLEYRFNLLIGPFSILLSVGINLLLWKLVMESNHLSTIQGMTLRDLGFYFTLTFIIHQLRSNWDSNFELIEDIRRGLVTRFLTRPISLFWNSCAVWMGRNIGFYLIYFLLFVVLKMIYPDQLFQSPGQTILFFFFLLGAVLLSHLLYMHIVLMNFWLNDVTGLIVGFNFLSVILFGTLIPYSFFPTWLVSLIQISPFPLIVAVPTEMARGVLHGFEIGKSVAAYGVWITVLTCTYRLVYQKAIRAYGGFGG